MGATREIGEWAATVTYDDIPERVHPKTKAQILSVLGAIHAGTHSEAAQTALEVARVTGPAPAESAAFLTGERLSRLSAIFANCCASVAFDFDDYLFAGHTGHSAVCTTLAYTEVTGASGRDALAAMTVANEVGGRLGASLLLGPHNGQMWAYIHLIESACAAGRLLGCDAERMTNAIGIALSQPVYPLIPSFMGPDSKLLIPSSTSVEGARAAELAARGWTGPQTIIEDDQGFLRKYNRDHFGWMLSGLGEAWLSDSLTYKVVPGCAYIDTAVDSLREILRTAGRPIDPDEIAEIHVRAGMFTMGMESFCQAYRSPDRLVPISINFSVALSFGLLLTAGELAPRYLSHKYLDANRDAIEAVAAKVRLEHDSELDRRAGQAAEQSGFSLRSLIGSDGPKTLEGVSFEGYRMAFPAEVTLRTTSGEELSASQDVPLGGSGRLWDETLELVREKFRANAPDGIRADEAIAAVDELDTADDVRELVRLLAP